MSVREEDKQKSCSSRGLGLAAAAIGVGVGAALYYFFSKRPEDPDSEGSTSQGWTCEEPQTLDISQTSGISGFTTISEHTTTDTSIDLEDLYLSGNNTKLNSSRQSQRPSNMSNNSDYSFENTDFGHSEGNDSISENSEDNDSTQDTSNSSCLEERSLESDSRLNTLFDQSESLMSVSDNESIITYVTSDTSEINFNIDATQESEHDMRSELIEPEWDNELNISDITNGSENNYRIDSHSPHQSPESDLEIVDEWDVTTASTPRPSLSDTISRLLNFISPVQKVRERNWSLEECSICFEVMLKDQALMTLPCTHNFHVQCIGPWLQEQATCPMCRKAAE